MTDRFQPPTEADELARCSVCGDQHHHESMELVGDDYFCENCKPERNEDEDEN